VPVVILKYLDANCSRASLLECRLQSAACRVSSTTVLGDGGLESVEASIMRVSGVEVSRGAPRSSL